MKIFQERLKQERKALGLTQRVFADKLGITQPSYTRYEKGTSQPTLKTLVAIADVLDVSIDYLLGRNDY